MELFVVNRYCAQKEDNESPSNEEKLKKDLLKKIEKRKRQQTEDLKEVTNDESNAIDSSQVSEDVSKKRKKRKKTVQLPDENKKEEEQPASTFLILGKDEHSQRKKAKRVLPDWLQNPSVVSVDLKNLKYTVESIVELDEELKTALKTNGVSHFFPVQAQVIPYVLKMAKWPSMYWPNDLCVSAPTGSGKTLAFVLPIIQILKHRLVSKVRALVVLPVHDLAKQVFKVFQMYSAHTNLKVFQLSNVRNIQEEKKHIIKKDSLTGKYVSLVDIIVTTPGRLVDHIKETEGFSLNDLRFLVIDEADRVMESVQNDWLYHVNNHLGLHSGATQAFQVPPLCLHTLKNEKRPPQKLLFSATLSQDPEKLQQLGLFQPKLFTSIVKSANETDENPDKNQENTEGEFVGKFTTPAELQESFIKCTSASKPIVLTHLLKERKWKHVLCFTKSREAARRLSILMKSLGKGSVKVSEITATSKPAKRLQRLQKFAAGKINMLICSDALARGIDVPNVECVISYDMPKYIKNHVHRVGRTGRAGKEGVAITFLLPNELNHFKTMMQTGRKSVVDEIEISEDVLEKYTEQYKEALGAVKKKLEIVQALKIKKAKWLKNPKRRLLKPKKKIN